MTKTPHRDPRPHSPGRLVALDAARAVAILGMVAVNVGPRDNGAWGDLVIRASYGRASILFVVLAGVGISLLTRQAASGGPSGRSTVFWRAMILLISGLALQLLDHEVKVILATYAALFLVALAFVRARRRILLISSITATLLGPLVWIATQHDQDVNSVPAGLLDSPGNIVWSVGIAGPYPVITWVGPFLLGMWLGRLRLTDLRLHRYFALWGGFLALGAVGASRLLVYVLGQPDDRVGWDRLVSAAAHSQMPLWLASSVGSALLVIGVLSWAGPSLMRWCYPVVALGRLSLTVYIAHLFVLALLVRPGPESTVEGFVVTGVIALGSLVIARTWCAYFQRGPLEALLRMATPSGR